MTPRVLVPLGEGFEEIEAVTVIDVLRRAGLEVVAAGLVDGPVRASRGVVLVPDSPLDSVLEAPFDAVVLPGGLGGSEALAKDSRIPRILQRVHHEGGLIAAICAAPALVLAPLGWLDDRRATCYPALADRLPDWVSHEVVLDDRVMTSQGPATAFTFALALVAELVGGEKVDEVASAALIR